MRRFLASQMDFRKGFDLPDFFPPNQSSLETSLGLLSAPQLQHGASGNKDGHIDGMNTTIFGFDEIGWLGIGDGDTSLLTEPETVRHLLEAYLLNKVVSAGALWDLAPNIGL